MPNHITKPLFSNCLRISISTIFLLCLFPAWANGQDLNAIERRLGEAVAEGEISLDQAQIMMGALRHSLFEDEHEQEMHRHHEEEMHREHERREHEEEMHREHQRREHEEEMHREHQRRERQEHEHDKKRQDMEQMTRRFAEAMDQAGIERGSIGPALEVAHKIAREMVEKRDRFELDDEMTAYMSNELRLNEQQVKLVVGVAKRISRLHQARMEREKNENRKPEKQDDSIEATNRKYLQRVERIKAAIEKGDLSEEDAEKKMIELRKKMFPNR